MSATILLAHGSGGLLSRELIRDLFVRYFSNPILNEMGDAAILDLSLAHLVASTPSLPSRLAFTTDSYVIQPLFFPGGDIGKLAVCGTVNDLAVAGAKPLFLSAGFILEEGLPLETLEQIVRSMAETAHQAHVTIVAGDTKVVERGAVDKLFITTTGLGVIYPGVDISPARLRPGDRLVINGSIGDHGLAVMMQREGLEFGSTLLSDCAPLHDLVASVLEAVSEDVHCMRDPTRGGLVSLLNEWAAAGVGIELEESAIPVRQEVQAVCEILGLDPLYAASEGRVVIAVAADALERTLSSLRAHPMGQDAAVIGRVTTEHPGRVVLHTRLGTRRVLAMPAGALLPRIC